MVTKLTLCEVRRVAEYDIDLSMNWLGLFKLVNYEIVKLSGIVE
jgi:hypothetical protein